jgi:hypothetical protein
MIIEMNKPFSFYRCDTQLPPRWDTNYSFTNKIMEKKFGEKRTEKNQPNFFLS